MSITLSKSLRILAFVCGVMRVTHADTSIFDNSVAMRPADADLGVAFISETCSDADCNRTTLAITSPHFAWINHTLSLVKRFELLLTNEMCHHYMGVDPAKQFAGIRSCVSKSTGMKIFHGTFFDGKQARYNFMKNKGNNDQYVITRELKQATDIPIVQLRSLMDSIEVAHVRFFPELTYVPVLGHQSRPVIELFIGIDGSFAAYFDNDKELIIKYVCMCVIDADILWQLMGIRVKLIGLRFWSELGFQPKATSFEGQFHELHKFVFGSVLLPGVMDFSARAGLPDRIPGTPDATMTFTHRFPNDGWLGLAMQNRSAIFGGSGIVLPAHDSMLTSHEEVPFRLHHYASSVTLAHEIGHIMFLPHSGKETECFTDHGECIMAESLEWTLPFWIKSNVDFIRSALNGSHQFLTQQNALHADVGTVHLVKRMSWSFRIFMWFIVTTIAAAAVWLMLEFRKWKGSP